MNRSSSGTERILTRSFRMVVARTYTHTYTHTRRGASVPVMNSTITAQFHMTASFLNN